MRAHRCLVVVLSLALGACAELPPDYLALRAETPAERELQTRRFDGIGEKELLAAAVGVMHDLGFGIETAGSDLGFLHGTRLAEAKAPGQKAVMFILLVLAASGGAAAGGAATLPMDTANAAQNPMPEEQRVSVLLSVRPAPSGDPRGHLVRVTFHSHVRQPLRHAAGPLHDRQVHDTFFEMLSRAVFLEANKL